MAPKNIELQQGNTNVANTSLDKQSEAKTFATSLHDLKKLETDITIDANKKNIDKLGVNIISECSTKATETIDLLSQGTDINKIDTDHLERLDTFIGWNVLGTVYGKLLRDAKNTDGTIDKNKYIQLKQQTPLGTMQGLQQALNTTGKEYTADEQKVVNFLLGSNNFATAYITNRFSNVLATMDNFVLTSLDSYNIEVKKDPSKALGEPVTPEKGAIAKAFDGITDRAKKNPGLAIAGGVGVAALGIWGLKKLFGGKKKKKKKDDDEGGSSVGNVLKWLGIGTGGYYVIHGLMTGKWGLTDFFDWDKNTSNQEKTKSYEDFKKEHPGEAEKYEGLGNSTDVLYESIFQNELSDGWQDDADMQKVSQRASGGVEALKGVVPFALEDKYSSVDALLSQHGEYMQIVSDSVSNITSKISGLVSGSFSFLKDKFFSLFGFTGTTDASFTDFISKDPKAHSEELKFFARETVRLQTFLLEKEQSLIEKIATEKLTVSGGFDDIHDAMKDSEWVKNNVYNDPRYTGFRGGKIKEAFDLLQKEGLLNATLTDDTKEIVKDRDDERATILHDDGTSNDLIKIKNDIVDDGQLTPESQKRISAVSQEIVKDMDDNLLSAMQETALSPLANIMNLDDAAKRAYFEKTGMLQCFQDMKKGFFDISTKVTSGQLSKDEAENFITTVNNYTAWKKEVFIGSSTLQEIKANKDAGDRAISIGGTWLDLMKNTYKGVVNIAEGKVFDLNTYGYLFFGGISIVGAGGILSLFNPTAGKIVTQIGKYTSIVGSFPISIPYKIVTSNRFARTFRGVYSGPSTLVRKAYFGGEDGPSKLWKEFKTGKISLEDASRIVDSGAKDSTLPWSEKRISKRDSYFFTETGGANPQDALLKKKFGLTLDQVKVDILKKYYDVGDTKTLLSKDFTSTMSKLSNIDTKVVALGGRKGELISYFIKQKGVSLEKIESLVQNIDTVDETILQGVDLEKLANKIAKSPNMWESTSTLEQFIKEVNKGTKLSEASKIAANEAWKDIGKNLTGDSKTLFDKTVNEVGALQRQKDILTGSKETLTIDVQIDRIKTFAQNVTTMSAPDAKAVLEVSDKISLKTLSLFAEDPKELQTLLQQVRTRGQSSEITGDALKQICTTYKLDKSLARLEEIEKGVNPKLVEGLAKELDTFAKVTKTLRMNDAIIKLAEAFIKIIR